MIQEKTALIVGVGASRGLGAAVARRFAKEGLHVVVAGRTAEKLDHVVSEIRAAGGSAQAVVGDGANESDAARFVASAEA
ncbi:SDR family NAD(P)-dependent oxidoreductase, partial [Rhodoferax sp. UBA5149]|uniref:SDR family NAD(P)-dependent oxidoreductase n=1 Tax=Rhodoferax sp. UBA5149 TaxID=1947379 RepID=UPI0025DC9308